jgi:hypothetical protein
MFEIHTYLIIYIIILILSLFELINKWNSKIKKIVYICVWGFLATFTGTRVCTGGDWIEYGNMFQRESEGSFEVFSVSGHELLFRLVAFLTSNLGLSFEHFLLIIALATSYLIAKSFYIINPKRIFLLTLLYYSVALFNQQFLLIRSGLAAALFLYGIVNYIRNEKKLYALMGITASLIHKSSIVPFIVGYFLIRKIKFRFIFVVILLSVIGSYYRDYLFLALGLLLVLSGSNYYNYIDLGGAYTEGGEIINTAYLAILFLIVHIFARNSNISFPQEIKKIKIKHTHKQIEINKVLNLFSNHSIFLNLTILFIVINISMPFHGIISRFNLYLLMPLWIFMIYTSTKVNKYMAFILNILIITYTLISITTIAKSPDLFIFQTYQSWLLDPSLTFDKCSTEGQY